MLAAKDENAELIKLLLKYNAYPNLKNNLKQTPLHIAAWNAAVKNVAVLLTHHALVNEFDNGKQTPLYFVLNSHSLHSHSNDINHFECAKMLVEAGAYYGQTIRELANRWNRFQNFLQSRELYSNLRQITLDERATTYLALLPKELIQKISSYETFNR